MEPQTVDRKSLIATRKSQPSDVPFIYSTWLQGYLHGNDWLNPLSQPSYYEMARTNLNDLFQRPHCECIIACLKEDPEIILGYSVFEKTEHKTTLHWVWVKPVWRTIGIAKQITPTDIDYVSHLTKVGFSIFKTKKWNYKPF